MRAAAPLMLGLLVGLGACGGGPAQSVAERRLDSALRVARLDFQAGRYEQAAAAFAVAEDAAWQLDDAEAIATAGAERALSLLRDDRPAEALTVSQRLAGELARRGDPPSPLATLVLGAAGIAQGQFVDARITLRPLLEHPDERIWTRAWYLLGLEAAERADRGDLEAAIAGLAPTALPLAVADRQELEARLALLGGRPAAALDALAEVRAARRGLDDLVGLGEALALSGRAAEAAGEPIVAGDFYLRAARSAAVQGRIGRAEAWLEAAERLAGASLAPAIAEVRERLG
ncbi:MAG: hypothetical protein ACOCYE_02905 [Pseudomonadota bacterium]